MCCSALPPPWALPSSGRAPQTAREMLWSKRWGGSAPLPSRAEREVVGAPWRCTELEARAQMGLLVHFLVSWKVTSEEKGRSVLFN